MKPLASRPPFRSGSRLASRLAPGSGPGYWIGRACWAGYRILQGTVAPVAHALALFDRGLRRFPGLGFLPPAWESADRFPSAPNPRLHPGVGQGLDPRDQTLWAHAASLGECAGLLALLRSLDWPGYWVLTSQTAAGLGRLRDSLGGPEFAPGPHGKGHRIRVHVAPFDHPQWALAFLKRQGINQVLLYESELWPGWIKAANQLHLPVHWVAARCSPRAARLWARFPFVAARVLAGLASIQARSPEDAGRIRPYYSGLLTSGLDAKGMALAGYPAAPHHPPAAHPPHAPQGRGLALYCLHRAEWPFFRPLLAGLMEKAPIFIFPRRKEHFEFFRRELKPLGFRLHSEGGGEGHVLVDAWGQSGRYLRLCRAAMVGGSWIPLGGHAFWEPLGFGLKLIAGPWVDNQQPMAAQLQDQGLLSLVPGRDLGPFLMKLDDNPDSSAESRLALGVFIQGLKRDREKALRDLRSALGMAVAKDGEPELSLV